MPPIQPKHIAIAALGLGIVVAASLAVRCGRSRDAAAPPPPETAQPKAVSITRDDILRATKIEAPDPDGPGAFSEYRFAAGESPPPAQGRAAYPSFRSRIVRIAIDARPSWAALLLANRGTAPGPAWTAPDGARFQVELVRIDDPVALRDAFAAGRVHAACGTVGALARWAPGLCRDSRSAPRVFQQFDWSAGADCIVARRGADLRTGNGEGENRKIVAVEDSPGEEFAIRTLIERGIALKTIDFVPVRDPLQAAALFRIDPSITACAGATPEIHALGENGGNRILATTADSPHLLAGIWFARADFARDHPDICEGLARGVSEGAALLQAPSARRRTAESMSAAWGFSTDAWLALLEGIRPAGPAENHRFFLDRNNPANFERTWRNACCIHRLLDKIDTPVPFTDILDFAVIRRIFGDQAAGRAARPARAALMAPPPALPVSIRIRHVGDADIPAEVFTIRFAPNHWDPPRRAAATLDEAARRIALQDAGTTAIVEGHADFSNRSKTDTQLARDLSLNRARSVKEALLSRLPDLDPSRISIVARGWANPADRVDPDHHAANRRAEIVILHK